MVIPRSRSSSIESSSCGRCLRGSTAPVVSRTRSASVDFPWSMWAMIEKFRMLRAGPLTSEDPRRAPSSTGTRGGKVEAQYTPPSPAPPEYPIRYAVDYPDRDLNRLTSFFRIFTVIPIAIVLGTVAGASLTVTAGSQSYGGAAARGGPVARPLLIVLFRKEDPRWWVGWD